MNWYKTAKQGSLLEPVVTQVARFVFNKIKNNIDSFQFNINDLESININRKELSYLKDLNISYNCKHIPNMPFLVDYNIKASFIIDKNQDSPSTSLVISIDVKNWPIPKNLYEEFYYSLYDIIRHELQHASQYNKDKQIFDNYYPNKHDINIKSYYDAFFNIRDYFRYLFQEVEIDANISSQYHLSKKKRIPLNVSISQYTNNIYEYLRNQITDMLNKSFINYDGYQYLIKDLRFYIQEYRSRLIQAASRKYQAKRPKAVHPSKQSLIKQPLVEQTNV